MVEAKCQRVIGWVLLSFLGHTCAGMAAAQTPPFVAGFERFARHGDIDPVVAGRLLIVELSCTECHLSEDNELQPKGGPLLDGVGNRLQHAWIGQLFTDPQQAKPGTTMPAMLNEIPPTEKPQAIRSLVAFLGSLKEPFPEFKGTGARPVPHEFWNSGDVQQGQHLYHRVGCVACHAPDPTYETVATKPTPLDDLLTQLDPQDLEEAGLLSAARRVDSVPLGNLVVKYTRQSLSHFLLNPQHRRPGGRMPDFQLGVVEAADVAAWLLREQGEDVAPSVNPDVDDLSLVGRGRELFTELGCANCHNAAGIKSSRPAKPFKHLDLTSEHTCLDSKSANLPDFPLDRQQRIAIQAAVEHAGARQVGPTSPASVQLTTLSLNCLACHERNQLGGVGRFRKAYFETYANVDLGDEGRLPPPLTNVGQKLKVKWMQQVLNGEGSIREHMRMRMPVFAGERLQTLPAMLAETDNQNRQTTEQDVFGDHTDLAEAGRQLLNTGCVQCHSLTGETLPGVIGTELEGIAARVHPQWFHDFVLNPGQLKPHTRMPSFFPQGVSQNQAVLEGNTERQIAAMWTYLKEIRKHPLPEKLLEARSRNYELRPMDRPLLLRTFMDHAGTHAIAVGFPQQVHYAFDAELNRLAFAWRGKFVDAQGTWFARFAPPVRPLGEDTVTFPGGVPFAFLKDPAAEWPELAVDDSLSTAAADAFRGYRLDTSGVPTFLYRVGAIDIEDRIEPEGRQLIRRMLLTKRNATESEQHLWLRAHQGQTLQMNGRTSCSNENGLTVSTGEAIATAGVIRNTNRGMEWILPLTFNQQQTIEVQYQW
ncbi:MAG: cytochrome c [Planctomycetaceae bacterium]